MQESPLAPAGAVFAQVFKILKPLGEKDGVASYLAEQSGAPGPRTLKTLAAELVKDPALRARFAGELQASTRVGDPHVARVLDAGVDEASGRPWFSREALKGESLASFAADRGGLSAPEVAELFAQLGQGLGAIHAAGLVHGDVRPETIFLESPAQQGVSSRVLLLDLGLAGFLAAARGTPAVGDPLWMAPEQADGRPPIQAAADVWAMGLVAFFLLVGKPYWKGAAAGSMAPAMLHREVLLDPLVPASTRAAELGMMGRIPDGFDAWFARCTARFPAERFPSAREAYEALRSGWGGVSREPLPSFALGPDSAGPRAPLPSFPMEPGGRAPLPSFDLEVGPPGPRPGPSNAPPPGPSFGVPPGAPPWGGGGGGPGWGGGPGGPPPYGQPGYGPPPGGPQAWGAQPMPKPSSPLPWILAIVGVLGFVVIGLIVGGAAFARYRQRSIEAVVAAEAARAAIFCPIPVTPADPSQGDATALVTIVEFGDFQCPFCKRVDPTLTALRAQYDAATLRIVWKHNPLPFHTNARPAAIAAASVFKAGGNDAFWKFHDSAFGNRDALTDENYESWATSAGADMTKWRGAQLDGSSSSKVDDDIALAKTSGVKGTPAFFVNGILVSGAQPITKFIEVVDAQKAAALAAIASGTRREEVYAKLTTENKAKAPLPTEEKEKTDETTVWLVPVGSSPVRGPATALVTVVEFADFQCPFCARSEKVLTQVREQYGSKVRFVWKNNPLSFHVHAEPAAELAMEAKAQKGDKAFWQMHDMLYDNQTHLEDTDLLGYGKRAGLANAGAWRAIASKTHAGDIAADQKLAKDLVASGTPTFFVNGRRIVGAQPIEKFSSMIDEEVRHAESLVLAGVPADAVYGEIMKTAKAGQGK